VFSALGVVGLALGAILRIAVERIAPDTRFDFEFAINRGTAKRLAFEVPPAHSARLRQT